MAEKAHKDQTLDKSLKILVKSSVIVFISIALSKILNYVYKVIIARKFGPEVYGLLSLAVAVFGLFIAFANLGLSEGLTRYIPLYRGKKETDKIRHIFQKSIVVSSALGSLMGILLFVFANYISINFFHNQSLAIYLKIFAVSAPFYIVGLLIIMSIRGYEKIGMFSFLHNVFPNATKVLVLIILISLGLSVLAVPYSYVFGSFLVLILAYIYSKINIKELYQKINLDKATKSLVEKEFFTYSIPILFLLIVTTLFYWIDTIAIGYFKTAYDVGLYNAAISMALLLNIPQDIFMQLFFPLITKEYAKKDMYVVSNLSKQVGKWVFLLNLPILIFIFIFPGELISYLFDPRYIQAANSLRILTVGTFFFSIGLISSSLILTIGKSKLFLYNMIAVSALNIILNIILVPKYGINGAAISTAISFITFTLIFFYYSKKHLDIIPFRRKMLKILLISIIPTIILIYIKQFFQRDIFSMISLGFIFLITYVLSLILTKCLDRNDLMILEAIKGKFSKKPL